MAAFEVVTEVVARVFAKCECGSCDKFSLGIVCGRCSRHVCLKHGYVTLGAPPESVCAACIIGDHPELLRVAKPPAPLTERVVVTVVDDGSPKKKGRAA